MKGTAAEKLDQELADLRKERAEKELALRAVEESRAALLSLCGLGTAPSGTAPSGTAPSAPSIRAPPTPADVAPISAALETELRRLMADEIRCRAELLKTNRRLGETDTATKKLGSQVAFRAEVEAREPDGLELDLLYSLSDVGWAPHYDINLDSKTKKMRILYWAKVSQQSGESWREAKVTVVSGKMGAVGQVPRQKVLQLHRKQNPDDEGEELRAGRAVAVAYELDGRRTLPNSTGPQTHLITEMELDPVLEYFCIPRQALAGFVRARAVLRSAYTLLPGSVALQRDGCLVSRSQMQQPVLPKEEFVFPLGPERTARLEYSFKEERNEYPHSKKTQITCEARLNVKNKGKERLRLTVLEQVPKNAEGGSAVKVAVMRPQLESGAGAGGSLRTGSSHSATAARLNRFNHIEWNLDLAPDEDRSLDAKFVLEFPYGDDVLFR